MRTTVEITHKQRAQLLQLAAHRGMKGFSLLIQEALDAYLASQAMKTAQIEAALHLQGCLSDEEAKSLRQSHEILRSSWR